mgnify:CR=1 FL=1
MSRYRSKYGSGRSARANAALAALLAAPGPLPIGPDLSDSVVAELAERREARWVLVDGVRMAEAVR